MSDGTRKTLVVDRARAKGGPLPSVYSLVRLPYSGTESYPSDGEGSFVRDTGTVTVPCRDVSHTHVLTRLPP